MLTNGSREMIKQELATSILLIYLIFTLGSIISLFANIIIKLVEIM